VRARTGANGVRRVIGYARVSSEEQARGTSLQDQQDAIRAYAKTCGLDVARFYVEAESAVYERIEKRDQIRYLLADVRAGDLVVCDKLDRWSRDPEFTYRSVREILAAGASFYAVGDRCDPSTPDGDSMLGIRVYVAREEHKRIKERLVGTRKLLRDKGYYVEGLPPLGYKRSLSRGQKGLEKNVLCVIEQDAELVRDIFSRCVRGESIEDIRKHLNRTRRSRKWDKKLLGKVLRNRVYLGEVLDTRGAWIKGRHEAILSPALFARAQDALASRKLGGAKPRANSHTSTWLLREIGACAKCGAKISAAYGAVYGKSEEYEYYYRCGKRCGVRYIRVRVVDAEVSAAVPARLAELREELAKEPERKALAKTIDFADRRRQLQEKRSRHLDTYADGLMSKDELRTKLAEVDAAIGRVEAQEADAARLAPVNDVEVRREMLRHIDNIKKFWRAASVDVRRSTLRELARVVKLERDKSPIVEWKSVEEIAADVSL
jgi:site-specific DNA recombinase